MDEAPATGQVIPRQTSCLQEKLPDFFLLGAAKSGTTSLHHYLRQHPALYLPEVKELDFFDAPEEQFEANLDWYLRYFQAADGQVAGEATPLYFRRPGLVPGRMRSLYGDTAPRFILLLRDPVDRAYSHYLHKVSQGTEPLSFDEALAAERERPEQKRRAWKSYYQDGLYAERLEAWYEHFSSEQFLILLSADLWQRPQATLRRIFRFLGVDPETKIDTSSRLNRTDERRSRILGTLLSMLPLWGLSLLRSWTPESLRLRLEQLVRRWATSGRDRPDIDPQIRRRLRKSYEPHVRRLADLIDRDLEDWLPGRAER
ncbi:MAG: sulfotransferase [Salinibacter sp.]